MRKVTGRCERSFESSGEAEEVRSRKLAQVKEFDRGSLFSTVTCSASHRHRQSSAQVQLNRRIARKCRRK